MQRFQKRIEHKQDRNEVLCFSFTADFLIFCFSVFRKPVAATMAKLLGMDGKLESPQ